MLSLIRSIQSCAYFLQWMCSLKVAIKKHHHLKPPKLAVIKAPHFLRDMDQINPIHKLGHYSSLSQKIPFWGEEGGIF